MHLTKALAALSAGSLLLIGHSTLAYAQDDPYTDDTRDEQSTETTTQETQDTQATQDAQDTQDDTWSSDTETTADADVDMQDDSDSRMDTYAQSEDDEFSADVDVDAESETDSDTYAQTDDDSFDASADVNADVDSTASPALQEQVAQIDIEVDVDAAKIEELAQIHVEMQKETRDLADQMSGAGSTADAQELQAQMVDRQIEVIERHGWTRDEYNAVVDTVNENPDLRAQFIENVVNRDTAVARTESEDPAAEDTDW